MRDMPLTDIPGPEICRRVRAASADIVVLGITSYSLDHYRQLAIDAGAQGLIAKSVTPKKELAEAMRNVLVRPFPGFPTDMQPQIVVALALAHGTSIVTESIFENRFKYVDELTRMGATIKVEGNSAIIYGTDGFTGARVSAPDLRAGAALVIAGLAAEGVTVVDDIVYIQRGYECFEDKLRSLGAEIERVSTEKEIQKFRLRVG